MLTVIGAARGAHARERLAVIILADGDSNLSDNLTEIAISKLAEARNREFVGLHELRSRLSDIDVVSSSGLAECLIQTECLRWVGITAGVERAVLGNVRRADDRWELTLELTNFHNARADARIVRSDLGGEQQLILAVQQGVTELFTAQAIQNPSLPAAVRTNTIPRYAEPKAQSVVLPHATGSHPNDRTTPGFVPHVAYGGGALGVLAFSLAAATGIVATGAPSGVTRSAAQADLERRKGYARITNALLVSGGVISAVSAVTFVWYWH
jgi:TolB-like protein